jgi:hypothetical protein
MYLEREIEHDLKKTAKKIPSLQGWRNFAQKLPRLISSSNFHLSTYDKLGCFLGFTLRRL